MIQHSSGNRSNVYGLGKWRFLSWQRYSFSSSLLLINGFATGNDQSSLPYANINNTWNYTSTFFYFIILCNKHLYTTRCGKTGIEI